MNLRLITLVAASGLWAGVAYGEPGAETAASAEGCKPTALVSGDPELAQSLGHQLRRLGVSSRENAHCPTATATIERGSAGVVVSLRGPEGRRTVRNLSDIRIAATWIDSWLHDDLGAPLLASRLLPQSAVALEPRAYPATIPLDVRDVSAPVAQHNSRRYVASVAYEAISVDQSTSSSWQGLRAGLCAQLGITCLGARISAARNSDSTISELDASSFARTSIDLLAHINVPISVGQAEIRPGLAFGAGWFQTIRKAPSCIEPELPGGICDDSLSAEAPQNTSTWAPKAEVDVSLSLPMAKTVRLSLGGSLAVRPFGAAESLRVQDAPEPCLEDDPSNPSCTGDPPPNVAIASPGEPGQFWKLFLGLEMQL